MPELPELESLARALTRRATGLQVSECQLTSISALKTVRPPLSALVGLRLERCARRGKFVCLELGGPNLVFHLARSGNVRWYEELSDRSGKIGRGPLALRVRFEDGSGFGVTEMSREKRLAIYVVENVTDVAGIATLGIEPFDDAFTVDRLGAVLAGAPGTVKSTLQDQSIIAGVGNAYSDEVLHAARLSPFAVARKLGDDDVARLHACILSVLDDAVTRSEGLPVGELKAEKKRGLKVHARTGEACPDCGDTIREVSYATKSLQYCPTCQTGGRVLADRRLSRLLR